MSEFQCKIEHIKGTENVVANALSRMFDTSGETTDKENVSSLEK